MRLKRQLSQLRRMNKGISIAVVVSMQLVGLLLFQLFIVRFVGVGPETDAYIAANAVPSVLNAIVGSSMASVWLVRLSLLNRNIAAWRMEQSLAQGQGLILGGTLVTLLMVTAKGWVPLLYPGFTAELYRKTVEFSFVLLGATVLNTQTTLLTVALRARDRFLMAEVISLFGTLTALLANLVLLPIWGLWAAVWIWFARSIVIYLMQMHIADWPWPAIGGGLYFVETWCKIRPLLLSASLVKTALLVDRYWASLAPAGGLTVLGLAQQGVGGMSAVLERAISMPVIPELTRLLERREYRTLRIKYRSRLGMSFIISAAIGGLLFVGRPWFIDVAKGALALSFESASLLWSLVAGLVGYLFVSIAGTVAISVLYAMGEMTLAARLSMGGFIIGLILKWQLFEAEGILGIVLAISLSYMSTFIMTVFFIELKLRSSEAKS